MIFLGCALGTVPTPWKSKIEGMDGFTPRGGYNTKESRREKKKKFGLGNGLAGGGREMGFPRSVELNRSLTIGRYSIYPFKTAIMKWLSEGLVRTEDPGILACSMDDLGSHALYTTFHESTLHARPYSATPSPYTLHLTPYGCAQFPRLLLMQSLRYGY